MISRFSPGLVLDLLVEFAHHAQAVILPPGCPTLMTDEAQRQHLPEELHAEAVLVSEGFRRGSCAPVVLEHVTSFGWAPAPCRPPSPCVVTHRAGWRYASNARTWVLNDSARLLRQAAPFSAVPWEGKPITPDLVYAFIPSVNR